MKYHELELEQLLYFKKSYDFIDNYGKKRFTNWSIELFEKRLLGNYGMHFFSEEKELKALYAALGEIGEEINSAGLLFLESPKHCMSRGGLFFWAYIARLFSSWPLKILNRELFEIEYMKIIKDRGIPFGEDKCVYFEEFDGGGMSGGQVNGLFAKKVLETVLERLGSN